VLYVGAAENKDVRADFFSQKEIHKIYSEAIEQVSKDSEYSLSPKNNKFCELLAQPEILHKICKDDKNWDIASFQK